MNSYRKFGIGKPEYHDNPLLDLDFEKAGEYRDMFSSLVVFQKMKVCSTGTVLAFAPGLRQVHRTLSCLDRLHELMFSVYGREANRANAPRFIGKELNHRERSDIR